MLRITFLSENKTDRQGCLAEHGLSILIEAGGKKILFDAGASSSVLLHNAKTLGIDLAQVDLAVISHGHYDHTQGLPAFCKLNSKAEIYIHRDAFRVTYGQDPSGKMDEEPCGILWTEAEKRALEPRLIYTSGVLALTEDIVLSGTIPQVAGSEGTEAFFMVNEQGDLVPDSMSHEQFLVIRDRDEKGSSKGIYIFSGCSHRGVLSVIQYAKQLFPEEKIAGFIAGMHLYGMSKEERAPILSTLLNKKIEMIMPVHCTGIAAICELKAALGEACLTASAGKTYVF